MNNQKSEEWLKKAIVRMRSLYQELNREQKLRCPVRLLCITPLQASALWIKRVDSTKNRPPIKNWILLLGYRLRDHKDLSINVSVGEEIVNKEYEFSPVYDFSTIFSGIKDLFTIPLYVPSHKMKQFRGKIEQVVIEFLREPRRYINPIVIWQKPRVFAWSYEIDLLDTVEKWLTRNQFYFFNPRTRSTIHSNGKTQPVDSHVGTPPIIMSTVSTFFYPPVWIGKPPKFPFEHKILNSSIAKAQKVFEDNYHNNQIFIKQNGKVVVISQDPNVALKIFNAIFAVAFYLGLEVYPVRRHEIAQESVQVDTLDGISGGLPVNDRFTPHEYFEHYSIDELEGFKSLKLSWVMYLFKILKNLKKEYLEMLKYLHESFTMLQSGLCTASFLFSWIILERIIQVKWFELSRLKRFSSNKWKESLKDWEVSRIIVALKISKFINKKEYMLLDEFRKIRNDIVHGDNEKLQEATAVQSQRAYELAFKFAAMLMYKNIGKIRSLR